jgi:hypothetical protein
MDIRVPFADDSEAWLIAVPITTYYKGPEFPGVDRIVLRIVDKRRGRVAVFRCSLRNKPIAGSWSTNVTDARKMCHGTIASTSDS